MSDEIMRIHPVEQLERHRDHDFTLDGYKSDRVTPAALQAGDVVRFKIWQTADAAPAIDADSVALPSAAFTADAGTDAATSAGHGLVAGQRVVVTSSGTLPAGLAASTLYYVVNPTTDTFQLALTSGGSAVDITDAGTGTHTWQRVFSKVVVDNLGVDEDTPFKATVQLHRADVDTLATGTWNWEAAVVPAADPLRCFVFALGTFDVVDNTTGDLGIE